MTACWTREGHLEPGGVGTSWGRTKKPSGTGISRALRSLRAGKALATTMSPLSRMVDWKPLRLMPAVARPLHLTDQIEVMYSLPEPSET